MRPECRKTLEALKRKRKAKALYPRLAGVDFTGQGGVEKL